METKTPEQIIWPAIEKYNPVRIYVGLSGGRDSMAVTHWMMNNVPGCEAFHINTGIGIKATRDFVRQTCKDMGWPLTEVRAKEDCGQDYDEIVKENGFPGPFGHRFMYVRLKERAIEKLVREAKKGKKDRVMFVTGIRHDESVRRMAYSGQGQVLRKGARVWVSPIYWWSVAERDRYIEENNLPVNPVSSLLGMSGECLCGAFAHKGEKEMVRLVCPETAARLDRLEQECLERGFTWGWEGAPPEGGINPDQTVIDFRPLCVGCEK